MSAAGHRAVPHTADVILEAWGPDLPACLQEAAAALVELYAEPGSPATARRSFHLPARAPTAVVLDLVDELIFLLDTDERVPIAAVVGPAVGGGYDVTVDLADRATVAPTGAVPKAVSHSGLEVVEEGATVRCRFLVDV